MISYKYNIYHSNKTKYLDKMLRECCFVWNHALLRDRTWCCPKCGSINDRDLLASKNILRKGISELESMSNSNDGNIGVSYVCIQESHAV